MLTNSPPFAPQATTASPPPPRTTSPPPTTLASNSTHNSNISDSSAVPQASHPHPRSQTLPPRTLPALGLLLVAEPSSLPSTTSRPSISFSSLHAQASDALRSLRALAAQPAPNQVPTEAGATRHSQIQATFTTLYRISNAVRNRFLLREERSWDELEEGEREERVALAGCLEEAIGVVREMYRIGGDAREGGRGLGRGE